MGVRPETSRLFITPPALELLELLPGQDLAPLGLGGALLGVINAPQKLVGTAGFPPLLELWKGFPALRLSRGLSLHEPLDSEVLEWRQGAWELRAQRHIQVSRGWWVTRDLGVMGHREQGRGVQNEPRWKEFWGSAT